MKMNPLEWSPVNETFETLGGLVQLRSSAPFGVSVEAEGVEAAAGYAAYHRLAFPGAARVTVTATAPVFRKDQPSRVYVPEGEVFTNIDRMPHESGTVAEITKKMRLWKLEQRALMREIREERALLEATRAEAEVVEPIEREPDFEAAPARSGDVDMKPGQCITKWWQELVAGRLRTPQDIVAAARAENPDRYEDRFTQDPQDGVVWTAPQRLMAHQFLSSGARAKQLLRADWQNTDKRLRFWAARVVLRAEKWGVPSLCPRRVSRQEEQDALVKAGTSKARYPKSAHNIGEAVDIVHGVYHWNLTPDEWRLIQHLARDELRKFNATLPTSKRLYLNWGGDDGTPGDTFRWDPAHWEIEDYRTRTAVRLEGVPVHMSPQATLKLGLA